MDFKKLGQQVGKLKQQAEDKLGDRAEPDNLKRDGKELRNILAGDGSLAEKAKEAKEKVIDRDKAVADDSEQKATAEDGSGQKATAEDGSGQKATAEDGSGQTTGESEKRAG